MNRIDNYMDKVVHGDCLEVLPGLPPASIDMILCDLPYGVTHNIWDVPIDLEMLWREYNRIIKPAGVIILTGQGIFTARLILSNPGMFRYKLVWIKSKATNFLNVEKQPLRKHEDICVFYNGPAVFNPQKFTGKPYDKGTRKAGAGNYNSYKASPIRNDSGKRSPTDVIFYEDAGAVDFIYVKSPASDEVGYHATQKPVTLGRYLVRTYSRLGDIVLDNACGSGSFLVAAILEGRRFIGIEKNNIPVMLKNKPMSIFTVCQKRITNALMKKLSMLPFDEMELFSGE